MCPLVQVNHIMYDYGLGRLGYAWVALLIATLWMMLVGSCLLTIVVIEF